MRYLVSLTLLFLLPADEAGSTTLQRFDLRSLTENAERVFHGRCTGSDSEVIEGRPYTVYRFAVDQMVKGNQRDEVVVRLLGGELDGQRFELVGMPTFSDDEEVVLFLTGRDRRNNPWPVGLSQGKFRVERVGVAKTAVVAQESSGARLLPTDGAAKGRAMTEGASPDVGTQPLDGFLQQIRKFIDEEPAVDAH